MPLKSNAHPLQIESQKLKIWPEMTLTLGYLDLVCDLDIINGLDK